MLGCGIQCMICDYPIHLDTYSGCAHNCVYCYANAKTRNEKPIRPLNNAMAVKRFIEGRRNSETRFCDWKIPIHWGANSDPFQPCELEYKRSLECLKIFCRNEISVYNIHKKSCVGNARAVSVFAETMPSGFPNLYGLR